jgi:hypothetical protein
MTTFESLKSLRQIPNGTVLVAPNHFVKSHLDLLNAGFVRGQYRFIEVSAVSGILGTTYRTYYSVVHVHGGSA